MDQFLAGRWEITRRNEVCRVARIVLRDLSMPVRERDRAELPSVFGGASMRPFPGDVVFPDDTCFLCDMLFPGKVLHPRRRPESFGSVPSMVPGGTY